MGNCFQASKKPDNEGDAELGNMVPKSKDDFEEITFRLNEAEHDHEQTKKTCINLVNENAKLKTQIRNL